MKKILLALAVALIASGAFAQTATFTNTPTSTATPLPRTPNYIPFKASTTGGYKFSIFTIPLDAAYPAGGWVMPIANFNMSTVTFVSANAVAGAANTGVVLLWDYTNSKLKCYKGTATAVPFTECAAGDASGLTTKLLVIGF